jgi:formylglycine-generating enzyme required for sulfatase activity
MQHHALGAPRLRSLLSTLALGLAATLAQGGETTNTIGITMVDIPAGSFVMGSCMQDKKSAFLGESNCANPDSDASEIETPQHSVSVKAFQMAKTEVTLGQFKRFIKAAGRSGLVDDEFMKKNAYGDNAPVVNVSWHDAQDFITWLNKTDGGGWRLPSEAEWEYACRAEKQHKYCGGNNLDTLGWHKGNSGKQPQPVARKKPNAFGLYDMSGNVWEWVQDCWHDSYSDAPRDGAAWASSCIKDWRGLRGGSWFDDSRPARAAYRGNFVAPGARYLDGGFRLARTR